jgi:hypothetical protein
MVEGRFEDDIRDQGSDVCKVCRVHGHDPVAGLDDTRGNNQSMSRVPSYLHEFISLSRGFGAGPWANPGRSGIDWSKG